MRIILNIRWFKFLFFLLFITSAFIPLKILSILLISPSGIFHKRVNFFQMFYLAMAVITVILGFIFLFKENYLYVYFLIIFFWVLAFLAHTEIRDFISRFSKDEIHSLLSAYFTINIVFIVIQLVLIITQSGSLNPFDDSASHGDMIKGIFTNSSANMIIMSFFAVYFFYVKAYKLFVVACFSFLMTGYMSGLVILLTALILVFLIVEKRISVKLYSLAVVCIIILFYYFFSKDNFDYAYGYIERIIISKRVPYKIVSFGETISFGFSNLYNFVFGAGPGNFSSRAAFVASGEYVSWWPKSMVYIDENFIQNHLGIWHHDFKNPWDNINNAANQPFSVYNQLFGEYGLVGVGLFLALYLYYPIKNFSTLSFGKIIFLAFLGFLLIDYWFEYFSIAIIFELFLLLDLKSTNLKLSNR